ncbi:hypothetical protein KR52_11230 [Synechococcus sp. KORDI-52]|nr:hypothetical protein KR52_11230 [Synechococcus sp. KORDI-52]
MIQKHKQMLGKQPFFSTMCIKSSVHCQGLQARLTALIIFCQLYWSLNKLLQSNFRDLFCMMLKM